ncbi:hypothetical protein Tco_0467035, partial [Tanacetum coccineum]
KLIIHRHEVQFNHALFNLLSNEMVSDVIVLGLGVLDIVAAERNSTTVVIIHGNIVEGKTVVLLFCFFDDQLTNLSPRN